MNNEDDRSLYRRINAPPPSPWLSGFRLAASSWALWLATRFTAGGLNRHSVVFRCGQHKLLPTIPWASIECPRYLSGSTFAKDERLLKHR